MPPAIHGFYLNEKKWIKLFVDDVHPVSYNTLAFERLVLPKRTKDLVEALVTVRTSQRGFKQGLGVAGKRTDITSGKGNGLIMLMHGDPGTGKTLTAESVAEIAKMPLYRVTCGDIGTNTDEVEKISQYCAALRKDVELLPNQVTLHYKNLNRSARKKIWQSFLDMLEEDKEDVNFGQIKLRLDDLAGKELDGRQIRNVLTTARQLANFTKERLDYDHLEQALSVSSDFSKYLKRVHGHTDDERIRDTALR
ncbi:MAG: hypothetical protein Q9184_001649 [Pyrenodesmia sp. 2 TL-2023]